MKFTYSAIATYPKGATMRTTIEANDIREASHLAAKTFPKGFKGIIIKSPRRKP